jgi:hypothetical protein
MTTADKIAAQIKEKFNNYEGRLNKPIMAVHAALRLKIGDEAFLQFLESRPCPQKYQTQINVQE